MLKLAKSVKHALNITITLLNVIGCLIHPKQQKWHLDGILFNLECDF